MEGIIIGIIIGVGILIFAYLAKIPLVPTAKVVPEPEKYGPAGADNKYYPKMNPKNILPKIVPQPTSSLKIVSHYLPISLWQDEDWREWLKNISENVKIEIIAGPKVKRKSLQLIKELLISKKIELWILKRKQESHFVIVDNKYLWIEERHIEDIPEVCYLIKQPYPTIREEFINEFETLKKESSLVITKVEDIIKIPTLN